MSEYIDTTPEIIVKEPLTWEDVITSSHCASGMHINRFVKEVVLPSRYTYFSWNGSILKIINEKGDFSMTNLLVQDIGKR
jgi:hypothetical protein